MSAHDGGSDDLIGTLIQERYRVLSRIGQGGMGVVYEVEHVLIGKRLALKRLDPLMARDPEVLMRFQREARAAAAIGDEHIVEVSDMGRLQDGSPYIVMELVEGPDLGRELEQKGALPISRAVHIGKECCSALGAAHAKGIIHRDVKPDNIFLTKVRDDPDFVKVLDFGISKFKEGALNFDSTSSTKTGTAIGTPHYMSPEQVRGDRSLDASTDVYAIGVVLYQMLSGRVPFDAASYPALVIKIASEPAPSLLSLRTDIPASLDQVVQKAMAKEPEERFGSVEELGEALSSFETLSGQPQLTAAGIEFSRTSTLQAREKMRERETTAAVPAHGLKARTWALLAGAVVTSVTITYLVLAPRTTGDGTEAIGDALPNLVRPATPEEPDAPTVSGLPAPSSPQVAALESEAEASKETQPADIPEAKKAPASKKRADGSSRRQVRKRAEKPADKAAGETRKKPARTITRPTTTPNPVKPSGSSSVQRKPATRRVVLKSQHRAAVTVELRCGNETATATVPAKSQATVRIPRQECRVTCRGLGHPSCPVGLRARAKSMEIH